MIMNYYKQIELFEYVSFDLFDTLIFRTFSEYSGVFKYVEYIYNKFYTPSIQGFWKKRIQAEKAARKRRGWAEVNLDEIYSELKYSNEVKEILKTLEVKVEIDNCVPNKEVVDIVQNCNKQNKKVIIITDMYLPRMCIQKILDKCGISCTKIFISGEEKRTKCEGDLFPYVLNQLNIQGNQLIHLGDNKVSDYMNPMKFGIKSVQYIRSREPFPYIISCKKDILCNHLDALITNGYSSVKEHSLEYKIGFSVVGPIMVEFCNWIHQMKIENKIDKLFFVAREGYLIKRCYEECFPEDLDSVYYVRVNKHLLRLPLLNKNNIKSVLLKSIKNYKSISWKEILEHFEIQDLLSEERIAKLLNKVNLNEKINIAKVDEKFYLDKFEILLSILQPAIDEQSRLLKTYLESFDIHGKKIGLVNNSYSGNGQALLQEFYEQQNINCEILGLQFAGNKICERNLGEKYRTWIPGNKENSLLAYQFERASLIFEHLLFESNGTALRMVQSEKGDAHVVCEEPRKEKKDFSKIKKFQMGAMDFTQIYSENLKEHVGFKSIKYFVNLAQNPTKDDAIILGNLYDDDVDGDRPIVDFSLPFNVKYLYKNDIYNAISWIQGYLKGKDIPDIYRKIFNIRVWLTNILHDIKK